MSVTDSATGPSSPWCATVRVPERLRSGHRSSTAGGECVRPVSVLPDSVRPVGIRAVRDAEMGPNRPGPGAHVATASFMVAASARGRGVGWLLGEYAVEWARRQGYAAMQFNAVVESNEVAVELYRRLGFSIIGTVPESFAHPRLGLVGLHVMHRYL
ncbi:GNAT family N-acetyltransferase [Micromonospora sp. ATA32]|nr:GNAT family N-acetyltransferase [Micromonospora sp. ATA32]